jgi:hypothetical protein
VVTSTKNNKCRDDEQNSTGCYNDNAPSYDGTKVWSWEEEEFVQPTCHCDDLARSHKFHAKLAL